MEKWKDVEGYEGLYQVSSEGRVKSLNYKRTGKEKILNSTKNNKGYLLISLWKEGKEKKYLVHRLVSKAFIPNPNNLPQVNHKDEDKSNNTIWVNEDGSIDYNKSNLEWCDGVYNLNYGSHNEKMAKSLSIPILQFTKDGEFIRKWESGTQVEREIGIDQGHISKCCKGKYKTSGGYIWKYNTIDNYLIAVLNKSFIENGLKIKRVA